MAINPENSFYISKADGLSYYVPDAKCNRLPENFEGQFIKVDNPEAFMKSLVKIENPVRLVKFIVSKLGRICTENAFAK